MFGVLAHPRQRAGCRRAFPCAAGVALPVRARSAWGAGRLQDQVICVLCCAVLCCATSCLTFNASRCQHVAGTAVVVAGYMLLIVSDATCGTGNAVTGVMAGPCRSLHPLLRQAPAARHLVIASPSRQAPHFGPCLHSLVACNPLQQAGRGPRPCWATR